MQPMNLTQVANTLAENPTRLHNWISRGQFQPPMFSPRDGKREWTPAEVLRLAIFVTLVNRWGVPPAVAGRLTVGPMIADESSDFFVAWHSQSNDTGEPWVDFIQRNDIGRFFRHEMESDVKGSFIDVKFDPTSAIVIDPAPIVRALREAWKFELLDWE